MMVVVFMACSPKQDKTEKKVEDTSEISEKILNLSIKNSLDNAIAKGEKLPKELNIGEEDYKIHYFLNEELENKILALLKRWKSNYTSVAVIDNNTGGILAAVDYDGREDKIGRKITFSSTHPAASLIKIITASTMIEDGKISYKTPFYYNGKSTTLYRNQLADEKNKWTVKTNFTRAFSISNNVVFAKAALKYSSFDRMKIIAENFGFNKSLMDFVSLGKSKLLKNKTKFELAELASGFNKKTLISPIHAASLSSVIANHGVFKMPQMISAITKGDKVVWDYHKRKSVDVLSTETARQLRVMMNKVIKTGSGRKMFLQYPTPILKKLIIGGKTGSITGGEPFGKRDWFTSFGFIGDNKENKGRQDRGISVAVMIINGKDWKVRSTLIAKKIYEFYFSKK